MEEVVILQEFSLSSKESKVVILGSGTPIPDPNKSGPSVAIIVGNFSYIVDCGPGIVRRAVAAHQKYALKALELKNLKRLFLTHLHSDHTLGYSDLIFTPWVMGRNAPLNTYGPKGTLAMTNHLLAAYREDIRERVDGLEHANNRGYRVNVQEINPGLIYEDNRVKVEAFLVNHGSWPCFGFKFFTPDRVIVISGDTAPTDHLIDHYMNCNVLIHEVYASKAFTTRPMAWQVYHSHVHTSSRELSRIASKVKPDLLILYHQLYWNSTDDELIAEIKANYSGRIVSGKDLEIY